MAKKICPTCGSYSCSGDPCERGDWLARSMDALEERNRRQAFYEKHNFPDMEAVVDMAAKNGFTLIEENGNYGLLKFGKVFISPKEGHDRKLLIRCAMFWASEGVWKHLP